MADLPQEMIQYHEKKAEIAELETSLRLLGDDIVRKYCPFKNGDKVLYSQFGDVPKNGVVVYSTFKGVSDRGIDKKWVVTIQPWNKAFNKKLPQHHVLVGKYSDDSVTKLTES